MKVKSLAIALLALWAVTSQADETFPVLKANGQVYSNATVIRVTSTDIFFYSAQGAGNIKIKDLDPQLRQHFLTGAPITAPVQSKPSATTNVPPSRLAAQKVAAVEQKQIKDIKQIIAAVSPKEKSIIAGVFLFFYLFFCYCFKRICNNCGIKPGILIWIPVFNLIPLLQAGKLSGWFFILFFVPIVNIVMTFVMWAKICQACGKSPWLVLLLLIPIGNLFLILYLAFSGSDPEKVAPPTKSLASDKFTLH